MERTNRAWTWGNRCTCGHWDHWALSTVGIGRWVGEPGTAFVHFLPADFGQGRTYFGSTMK